MNIDATTALMKGLPIFSGFSREEMRLMAFGLEEHVLEPDDVLYSPGDIAESAYLIASGEVVLVRPGAGGIVSRGGPGTFVGERALLVEGERTFTCVALRRSLVLEFPRYQFVRLLGEYPHHARRVRSIYRHRLVRMTRHMDQALRAIAHRSSP